MNEKFDKSQKPVPNDSQYATSEKFRSQLILKGMGIADKLEKGVKSTNISGSGHWKEECLNHIEKSRTRFKEAEKEKDSIKSQNLINSGLSELHLAGSYMSNSMEETEKVFNALHVTAIGVGVLSAATFIYMTAKYVAVYQATTEIVTASPFILKSLNTIKNYAKALNDKSVSTSFGELESSAQTALQKMGTTHVCDTKEFFKNANYFLDAVNKYADKVGLSPGSVKLFRDELAELEKLMTK